MIELCKEAKARAQDSTMTQRLYALVVLLQTTLGQNQPEDIISGEPGY
jgi:hypothetical protein